MAEDYFKLSPEEKREALAQASTESGRPIHLLEKDVWVVWTLKQLFSSSYAEHLVFKGGTSLSKAYQAIDRFSEDIDITYDIRAIASDLVATTQDGFPPTKSQQKKWTDDIRKRLAAWTEETMLLILQDAIAAVGNEASVEANGETITITYKPLAAGTGYVSPKVKIDFGARSTGEPSEQRAIKTDAAPYLSELIFPECNARVMRAERTFWEKATAIHVYCLQGKLGGERYARHWYDLVQLDKAGIVASALKARDIAEAVAKHKSVFFPEKDTHGEVIDYATAAAGHLKLVPQGEGREILLADYQKMLDDGLLPAGAETFVQILKRCADIEDRANIA